MMMVLERLRSWVQDEPTETTAYVPDNSPMTRERLEALLKASPSLPTARM